ncbi:MAG TPA: divalent-cation tolerance protein CutA [Longimicrobiales bacterium]
MDAGAARVVLVTTPDVDTARTIARALVEERLAACGNVVTGLTSIYRWQGSIEEAGEALLILKTSDERLARMSERIVELHPYDVPEVLALTIDAGHQPYLDWIDDCLRGTS